MIQIAYTHLTACQVMAVSLIQLLPYLVGFIAGAVFMEWMDDSDPGGPPAAA